MLITQPCLCRTEARIPNQSDESAKIDSNTAKICVQSATSLTGLLPAIPDLIFIYQEGPWWSLTHYIMQAIAVLLLDIANSSQHAPHDTEILQSLRKLIQWLSAMRVGDSAAERACRVVFELVMNGRFSDELKRLLSDDEQQHYQPYQSYQQPSTEDSWQGQPLCRHIADDYGDHFIQDPSLTSIYGNLFVNKFDVSNPFWSYRPG